VGFDPNHELSVFETAWTDKSAYHELANAHTGKAVTRRVGGAIGLVARFSNVELPGAENRVPTERAPHLVAALLKDWLIDLFHDAGRVVRRRRSDLLVTGSKQAELLQRCLPHGVQLPAWLAVQASYEFSDRIVPRPDGRRVILVCNPRTRYEINASADILMAAGVPLQGLYVCEDGSERDSRITPRRPLLGRVVGVDGDTLQLEGRDGTARRAAAEIYLEARSENIERVIRIVEPRFANEILNRLQRAKATAASGPDRLKRLRKVFEFLAAERRELAPGFFVDFGKPLYAPRRFPRHEIVPKPDLIFDSGGRQTDHWNQRGLDTYGPQDQYQFSPKKLNIAVICQAHAQGRVDEFLARLLKGMPDTKAAKKGFIDRFRLEPPYTKVFTTPTAKAADYRVTCAEAVEHITDRGETWNLALIQIDDGMDELVGDDNPYLVTKAFFLARQVAVQQVELETMEQRPNQLAYAVNNVGLAAYAKLGGIPWLLPTSQKVAHELVVGLGSFKLSTSRFGAGDRYVGVTTVFTGSGRYLVESRTRAVPFEDYTAAMLEALKRSVEEVRATQNWRPDDPVRLVFHVFKPVKGAEVRAVKKLMESLDLPHAEYAFVHVAENHPFLLFDENEKGANAPGGKKGILAPPRGLAVYMGDREAVLAFKGAREVKQASDGLPRPVRLDLHRDSTFRDLTYLARQAFAFSCHSWRSLLPSPQPITILYSQLVARNLRLLEDVDGWKPDQILGPIGRTRWFL
jgi:hypothetical protein